MVVGAATDQILGLVPDGQCSRVQIGPNLAHGMPLSLDTVCGGRGGRVTVGVVGVHSTKKVHSGLTKPRDRSGAATETNAKVR